MANRGYDVVVDVDTEGDLGHTDFQENNLEFHPSDFGNDPSTNAKIQPDSNTPFLSSTTNPSNLPNSSNNNNAGGVNSNLRGATSSPSKRHLWSLSFYSQFFDVDTSTVLTRCRAALLPFLPPFHKTPFLDTLDGNPDLYGPFWIATTVVVILFLTGTISQYLAAKEKGHFAYDFKLLSGAAGLVYGYSGIVPAVLWAVLRWYARSNGGNSSNNIGSGEQGVELVECWALYGYANLVWIMVALLSWSPLTALNYALVALGYASTVYFLVKNLYPVISATEKKTSQILLVAVVLLHAGLAIAIKILFFAHASPARKGEDGQAGEGEGEGGGERMRMLF